MTTKTLLEEISGKLDRIIKHEERKALSPEETAQALGLGIDLTRRKIREGVIPSMRIGGRIIVPKKQLDTFLEGGDHGATNNDHEDNLSSIVGLHR